MFGQAVESVSGAGAPSQSSTQSRRCFAPMSSRQLRSGHDPPGPTTRIRAHSRPRRAATVPPHRGRRTRSNHDWYAEPGGGSGTVARPPGPAPLLCIFPLIAWLPEYHNSLLLLYFLFFLPSSPNRRFPIRVHAVTGFDSMRVVTSPPRTMILDKGTITP